MNAYLFLNCLEWKCPRGREAKETETYNPKKVDSVYLNR